MKIFVLLSAAALFAAGAEPVLTINTPMAPPAWALLERQLLKANSIACERFAGKYLDSRGYLLHTPRWGTIDDGPDDAIETFYNWTLLHALGGSDSVLPCTRKLWTAICGSTARRGRRRRISLRMARTTRNSSRNPTGSTSAKACAHSCSWASRIRTTTSFVNG